MVPGILPDFEEGEALRRPLESGEIRIARAGNADRFPCRFLLVAANNPCPCGNFGHPRRVCRVARTIADLAGEKAVSLPRLAEAVQYRLPDFNADKDEPERDTC